MFIGSVIRNTFYRSFILIRSNDEDLKISQAVSKVVVAK